MLLVMCVDGLDIEKAKELGLFMPHYTTLSIPKECYIEEIQPHTFKIWSSIFTGRIMDKDIRPFKNKTILQRLIRLLYKFGKIIKDEKAIQYPITYPYYIKEESIFNNDNVFGWNIPTFSIDYNVYNYGWMEFRQFCKREFRIFRLLCLSSVFSSYDVFCVYTRILDIYGHWKIPTDEYYRNIFYLASKLSEKVDVMLLSDHGTRYEDGLHTEESYLGTSFKFQANSVLDVRSIIEEYLK